MAGPTPSPSAGYLPLMKQKKDYITTYSGVRFFPLEPKAEDLRIEDIAHALSMMTRANGHLREFYSVGQHVIACTREAMARGYSRRVALGCLLHDASEAYMSDITRPLKQYLERYLSAEAVLQGMVYERYLGSPLTDEEQAQVHNVDNAMLYHEFKFYSGFELEEYRSDIVSTPRFYERSFREVEEEFLSLFYALSLD